MHSSYTKRKLNDHTSGSQEFVSSHSCSLRDDDLAYLMQINTKDLHKICGKLREDRFLTVYVSASRI